MTKKKLPNNDEAPREIVMAVSRFFPCPVCHGTGEGENGHVVEGEPSVCELCKGEGQLTIGSEAHLHYYFRSSSWGRVVFRFGPIRRTLTKKENKKIASVESSLRELWQLIYGVGQTGGE
jgi:hypothetical protein